MDKTEQNDTGKYELFHSSGDYFWTALRYDHGCTAEDVRNALSSGKYELVQTFQRSLHDVEQELEETFRESQNIDYSWRSIGPCRSTSVGDVIRVGEDYWIVAPVGFDCM